MYGVAAIFIVIDWTKSVVSVEFNVIVGESSTTFTVLVTSFALLPSYVTLYFTVYVPTSLLFMLCVVTTELVIFVPL